MKPAEFKIEIPESELEELARRLKNTRWPDEKSPGGWDYGTNLTYLKSLVNYWQTDYNWRKQEASINTLAHYKTVIDGVVIHYIHEKGKGNNPLPILLTHGWPDCFLRFQKIIPMLTDPASFGGNSEDSFDVIVPSIPGFGFSGEPSPAGNIFKVNDLWAKLMTEVLGYQKYAAQGGDFGAIITERLAKSNPGNLAGIHLTDIPFMHAFKKPSDPSAAEQEYFAKNAEWQMKEGAYNMIQSTRPQTLSMGLADSPVGFAAWIIEKFQSMNDCNGDIEKCFSRDELLNNIMIYWFTKTISSSFMGYYDLMNAGTLTWLNEKVKDLTAPNEVPAAFALFPAENTHPPREWAERFFNVQRWTPMAKGGHFAAMEQPGLLAEDIKAFFRDLRD